MNYSCDSINLLGLVFPHRFHAYRTFAFTLNGVLSTAIICFGLVGNILLVKQVMHRATIRHRLGQHLVALCFWDSLLLLTRLLSSASVALIYKNFRLYGWPAVFAYGVNPVSNFAVSGNIWQVVSICTERYMHVLHPLMSRVYAQCVSVKTISISIILLGFVTNFSQYFEYGFVTCLESQTFEPNIQIVAAEFTKSSKAYTLAVHLIPDLFLRCPVPFLLVSYFTFNTIFSMRKQRRARSELLAHRLNSKDRVLPRHTTTAIALALLGAKFLLCNSLFMAHTVLELISLSPQNYWSYYLMLLYLADVSNFLLLLNAATDWLLFFRWSHNQGRNMTVRRSHQTQVLITMC